MRHKPFNPAAAGPQIQIHDRRAKEINRRSAAHIVETEVDDPYETGAKIATVRSVRSDPLADHYARGHIDQAQFMAGRQFQKYFGIAERGPRSVQFTEAVDGNPPRETLTDGQRMAWKRLTKCYERLGADGTVLVHCMLVHGMTAKQVAKSRDLRGQDWNRYFSKSFGEALNTLAVVFGFASGARQPEGVPPGRPKSTAGRWRFCREFDRVLPSVSTAGRCVPARCLTRRSAPSPPSARRSRTPPPRCRS